MIPQECERPGCGELFPPRRNKRFCSEYCKKRDSKEKAELDRLAHEVWQQRTEAEHEEARAADHSYGKRLTGQPRECRCNGSGRRDYDQDGDPFCLRCGGWIAGDRNPEAALRDRDWQATRNTDSAGREAKRRHRPPTTFTAKSADRPEGWGDVRVYRGEPFKPTSPVSVTPGSAFKESGS